MKQNAKALVSKLAMFSAAGAVLALIVLLTRTERVESQSGPRQLTSVDRTSVEENRQLALSETRGGGIGRSSTQLIPKIDPSATPPYELNNVDITPNGVEFLTRGCPGQSATDCGAISKLSASIASAQDDPKDGWPVWMQHLIVNDLDSIGEANHFSAAGAKCSSDGCIFFVSARFSTEFSDEGLDEWVEKTFEPWLRSRTWMDELVDLGSRQSVSTFARSRVFGSHTSPFRIWYVLRRRPFAQ